MVRSQSLRAVPQPRSRFAGAAAAAASLPGGAAERLGGGDQSLSNQYGIAMVKPWPIEIDGLPFLNMVIFHGELLNSQMVIVSLW